MGAGAVKMGEIMRGLDVRLLRGKVRELINDSYDNISLFIFYVISTI